MQLANDASVNTIKIAKPHPNASDEQASEFHSVDLLSAQFAVQKHLLGLGVETAATTNAQKHRPPSIDYIGRPRHAASRAWLNHTNNYKLSENTC